MRALTLRLVVILGLLFTGASLHAQLQVPSASAPATNNSALTDPTFHVDVQVLLDADKRFAAEVLKGGGAVFASWFADDAITMSNKQAVLQGKSAITSDTTWKPADYQLIWAPDGARLGPHGEMGITWGHFEGHSHDNQGNPIVTSGRYLTVWEKDKSGRWKVLADTSNEAPVEKDSCCSIH
jgi:ketosteroid isomerase-like protein